MAESPAIKVLFVAGLGRSGSTLLDNVLGSVEGFFSLGELIYIWDRCVRDDRRCGCGEAFSDCPFWAPIRAAGMSGVDDSAIDRIVRVRESLGPGGVTLRSHFATRPLSGELIDEFVEAHLGIYRAIRDETGCRVIVDSSKWPGYGFVLSQMPGIEPYYLHLVRDPRPVAYSWQKKKIYDASGKEPLYMSRFSIVESCRLWNKWNIASEILLRRPPGRYLRLHYEDFVDRPRRTIEKIAEHIGESPSSLPFVSERDVRLAVNHAVGGNPSRFESGVVSIRRDDTWRQQMSSRQRSAVLALTWPFFLRYRYPR